MVSRSEPAFKTAYGLTPEDEAFLRQLGIGTRRGGYGDDEGYGEPRRDAVRLPPGTRVIRGGGRNGEDVYVLPPGYDPDDFRGGGGYRELPPAPQPMKLTKSLKDTFNAAVEQAVKDHPVLEGKFLFINMPEDQVISKVQAGATAFRSSGELQRLVQKLAQDAGELHSSFATNDPRLGGVNAMLFTPLPFRLFTTKDQPYEMEAMATFYHELAHLVAPFGSKQNTLGLAENVADVYAILRMKQKYGAAADDMVEVGAWSRALRFVLHSKGDHFTTLSIDAIEKETRGLDLARLTPDRAALLASRIASEHTPNYDIMETVGASFSSVMPTIAQNESLEAGLKRLAEITLSSDAAYYTFRIGYRALKRFTEGKVSMDGETQAQLFGHKIFDDTGPIKLEGKYWDDVRARLEDRWELLQKRGVLMGMPMLGDADAGARANDDTPKPPPPPPKRSSWLPGFLGGAG